jgi:hypothetical protein
MMDSPSARRRALCLPGLVGLLGLAVRPTDPR